jgi:hypothetical protein
LNDIPDQEECLALINQTLILNNTSSRMHHIEISLQFKFLEHGESQSDFDVPIFEDYFYVLELKVNTNLSFIGPAQSQISDLDAQMLTKKNTKCIEYNDFSDIHKEIMSNEQPITMTNTRNIELNQEMVSSQYDLELNPNPQGRCLIHSWILF